MGVDISHDCFSGPYSAFNRWRDAVARVTGYPSLYDDRSYRANWYYYKKDSKNLPDEEIEKCPLAVLIYHLDCEGFIEHEYCMPIADELDKCLESMARLSPTISGVRGLTMLEVTNQFIAGLRLAHGRGEDVEFT